MKLYFSPGSCSLAIHIVLRETGLPFELERVDLKSKLTAASIDFTSINPKGYVPVLQLVDNTTLTEVAAIAEYLADQAPHANLAPIAGSMERYRLIEWLNFISSEIHKGFAPLFNKNLPVEVHEGARAALSKRIGFVASRLQHSTYLNGEDFTVADAYLYTVLNWARLVKLELASWPAVVAYMDRISERPAVQAALEAEGLLRKA